MICRQQFFFLLFVNIQNFLFIQNKIAKLWKQNLANIHVEHNQCENTVHAFVHYLIIHLSDGHQASLWFRTLLLECIRHFQIYSRRQVSRLGNWWNSRYIKMKQAFCHGCNTFGAWSIILIILHGCMHTHANIHTTPYNRLLLRESLLICFFLLKVINTESSVQIFNWNNKKSTFTTFTSKGFYNKLIYQGLWKW